MGRGRAKAKQAKVARQLKYSGASTDLEALRKELVNGSGPSDRSDLGSEFDDVDDDEFDEQTSGDDYDEEDDFGGSYRAGGGRR